ncbi:hypothetical protein BcepSauron_206 [Burkholderia phage BcepSauron]|uniref:Uncharacterized protein n=1 Tax=Burkholderia phage BcepSauron TaxID=2530033 RepID=A0A482MM46_9CAUD|nr:hypothetical protein H1O17_gp206 [Burkholderia phage BcepSauron]QBQ74586.1 hypothetical protein BcepSauron_206 [Burkholderia phage BcepSauron]
MPPSIEQVKLILRSAALSPSSSQLSISGFDDIMKAAEEAYCGDSRAMLTNVREIALQFPDNTMMMTILALYSESMLSMH